MTRRSTRKDRPEPDRLEREGLVQILRDGLIGPAPLPDVVRFLNDPHYAGIKDKQLYPKQRTLLRTIFYDLEHMTKFDHRTLDEWEASFENGGTDRIGIVPGVRDRIRWGRGHGLPHTRRAVLVAGRRGSKTQTAAGAAAYKVAQILSMESPQQAMGLDPIQDLRLAVVATNQGQAKKNLFANIRNILRTGRYFAPFIASMTQTAVDLFTPADLERVRRDGLQGTRHAASYATVHVEAQTSMAPATRGVALFGLCLDEMAFMVEGTSGPRSADEVYTALAPALAEMGPHALILITSSPATKTGRLYELFQQGLALDGEGNPVDPTTIVAQFASWSLYEGWDDPEGIEGDTHDRPILAYDEGMQREERLDPQAFRPERRGQWSEVLEPYFPREFIDGLFAPYLGRVLEMVDLGNLETVYRANVDLSVSRANTALVVAHLEEAEAMGAPVPHVVVDRIDLWRPGDFRDEDGRPGIDFQIVERDLFEILSGFYQLALVSFDLTGAVMIPWLRQHFRDIGRRVPVRQVDFTGRSKPEMYETLKMALGQGWVSSPRDRWFRDGQSLLEMEARFLEVRNGKIGAPTSGPVKTDDVIDSLAVVVHDLMTDFFRRNPRRAALSNIRPAFGAPGGYNTKFDSGVPVGYSEVRRRLDAYSGAQPATTDERLREYGLARARQRALGGFGGNWTRAPIERDPTRGFGDPRWRAPRR